MVTASFFTIAKRWKPPKCLSADAWMTNMWCKHAIKCHRSFKGTEILTQAPAWMNLEDIMMSKQARPKGTDDMNPPT